MANGTTIAIHGWMEQMRDIAEMSLAHLIRGEQILPPDEMEELMEVLLRLKLSIARKLWKLENDLEEL